MVALVCAVVLFAACAIAALFRPYRPAALKSWKRNVKFGLEGIGSSKPTAGEKKRREETQLYKMLYHQVQNLEDFPGILTTARQSLLSLLRQALLLARLKNTPHNILDITEYNPEELAIFMASKRQDTLDNWSAYSRRREAGGGPEMFVDREAARQWLKDNAPLQLVDGAWVARVHNITTPFHLRGITKDAWQTYCEELGDGDLDKNHCFIYKELLREIGFNLPDQNDADFIHPRHELDNDRIWRASAGHLLISLFPNDFLPEILGFNLHYESLAPQTLKAAKELPEYGISGYYFAVHICIDNADSGHSAMAEATIRRYLNHVRETGSMNVQQAWQRVQAGFLLSEYLDGDEDLGKYQDAVAEMIHKKANVAGQVHCSSPARIGGRKLTEWFSSDFLSTADSRTWQDDFMTALARSKPWVFPGESDRSLLVRELSWKGRMFGAFTQSEVQYLRTWIDLLEAGDDAAATEGRYWKLVGNSGTVAPNKTLGDAAVTHPAFPPQQEMPSGRVERCEFVGLAPLSVGQTKLEKLLPLWFMHPCILEQIVMSPYRTTTRLGSLILQLLRAETGYKVETPGVAGMDEQRESGHLPSLTALGVQIVLKNGLREPLCLGDVLRSDNQNSAAAIEFAYTVLGWAARPVSNGPFLIGLARAFLDLEAWVYRDESLLDKEGREALRNIIRRKEICFKGILSELEGKHDQVSMLITGYEFGRVQIERLLV